MDWGLGCGCLSVEMELKERFMPAAEGRGGEEKFGSPVPNPPADALLTLKL